MGRPPPNSTPFYSSAASDVYKGPFLLVFRKLEKRTGEPISATSLRTSNALPTVLASYTHLRPPEPVLDPVCRLLLEKKKI